MFLLNLQKIQDDRLKFAIILFNLITLTNCATED